MGLALVRIDDRLVHGQVMVGWRNHLGATQVLVASDRLAANPSACNVLRLTAPQDVGLVIDSVDNLAKRLRSGEFEREKVILLFENLADIIRALDQGVCLDRLNLGGLRHQDCRIAFSPSVSLSDGDIRDLREILKRGIPVEIQMVPLDKCLPLSSEMLERRS